MPHEALAKDSDDKWDKYETFKTCPEKNEADLQNTLSSRLSL